MRHVLLMLCVFVATVGCKQSTNAPVASNQNAATNPAGASPVAAQSSANDPNAQTTSQENPKTDACAMLTSDDIKSVQGEPVKETKLTGGSDGGFSVSQCFFTLPTFINSISLAITQRADGAGARDPKEFWKETFHRDAAEVKKERERKREVEGEEKDTEPQKVRGVGDEAFWMGSRVGGALYVLKGNSYVRISIGGAADQETKLKRSKELAQKIVARL